MSLRKSIDSEIHIRVSRPIEPNWQFEPLPMELLLLQEDYDSLIMFEGHEVYTGEAYVFAASRTPAHSIQEALDEGKGIMAHLNWSRVMKSIPALPPEVM